MKMVKIIKSILKWAITTKILAVPRRYVNKVVIHAHIVNNERIIHFNDKPSQDILNLISQVKKETVMIQGDIASYFIYTMAKKSEKIQGDIAEVGVYKGGTAKLICEARSHIPIHLFDTFEGLPSLDVMDNQKEFHSPVMAENLDACLEDVIEYLREYTNVHFYKGLFPNTATPIEDKMFSFVHLDVDLYQSTKDCLEFFYPRMNKGGIIISHDYISLEGVRKAFDEFFNDKPEIIFELLSGEQCLVVKL